MKIEEGNVSDIVCPQVNCFTIISNETIERLVSKETAKRYLHFDIKAFVDSNPNIKWCPYPGCGNAIKNPKSLENKTNAIVLSDDQENQPIVNDIFMSVDCGQGHYSCWYIDSKFIQNDF